MSTRHAAALLLLRPCICCVALGQGFQRGIDRFPNPFGTHSTRSDGGLHFTIESGMKARAKDWPGLSASTSPFPANWRGGNPFQAPFGRIVADQDRPAGVELVERSWVFKKYRYSFHGDDRTLELILSRLSPAIVFKSGGREISLFDIQSHIGGGWANPYYGLRREALDQVKKAIKASYSQEHYKEEKQRFDFHVQPRYIAFPTAGAVRVAKAPCSVEGGDISEPWALVWFGKGTYLPGLVDSPMLLRFQTRPKEIRLDEKRGLVLRFAKGSGHVALMSLYGFRHPPGEETESWSGGLPDEVADRCRRWAGILRYYPTSVEESFKVDRARDRIIVGSKFKFLEIEDDWGSRGERIAPLPPMLAAAYRQGFPVTFSGAAKDLDHIEVCGPLMGIEGVDQYTYEVPGILKYLDEKPEAGAIPKEAESLRRELEAQVRAMLEAGHLQPSFFASRCQDFSGPLDYWCNPGQLVYTLSEAYDLLPAKTRREVKDYLKKEMQKCPPWRIGHVGYGSGRPRDAFDIPPEETDGKVPWKSIQRFMRPQGPPCFDTLYSMWSYAYHTGDRELVEELSEDIKGQYTRHLRSYDWAIMGVSRSPGIDPQVLAGLTGAHTYNTVLAGLIGYRRLSGELGGSSEDPDFASYLAMKHFVCRFAACKFHRLFEKYKVIRFPPDMPDVMKRVERNRRQVLDLNESFVTLTDVIPSKKYLRFAFLNLVPEVGRFLHDHCLADVKDYVELHQELRDPYWFVPRSPDYRGESSPAPYSNYWGLFQAKAYALEERGEELEKYLHCPAALGDLYYIQNLTAAIRAHSERAWSAR